MLNVIKFGCQTQLIQDHPKMVKQLVRFSNVTFFLMVNAPASQRLFTGLLLSHPDQGNIKFWECETPLLF
jgi:hypothetical protein